MTRRADRATPAQVQMIENLTKSHVFTAREREETRAKLFGAEPATNEWAGRAIDRALKVIRDRKAREDVGEFCHFCDDAYATHDVYVEQDVSRGDYTEAVRYRVQTCPSCAHRGDPE